jgi:hypothetical protein
MAPFAIIFRISFVRGCPAEHTVDERGFPTPEDPIKATVFPLVI